MDLWTFLSKLIWPGILIWVLIRYEKQIREFFGTLKEWTEISAPGMGLKRKVQASTTEPPEPTGKKAPEVIEEEPWCCVRTLQREEIKETSQFSGSYCMYV